MFHYLNMAAIFGNLGISIDIGIGIGIGTAKILSLSYAFFFGGGGGGGIEYYVQCASIFFHVKLVLSYFNMSALLSLGCSFFLLLKYAC